MTTAKTMLRRVIRSVGYDVIRVPASGSESDAPAEDRASPRGSKQEFLPHQADTLRFKPWPIPPELRARTELWVKVLLSLYALPASWPACVSPETGMLIHALVRNLRPRVVVETGTCHGASTIWIAAAMHAAAEAAGAMGEPADAGIIHTFDCFTLPPGHHLAERPLYQNQEAKVRQRFVQSGFEKTIRMHIGDSSSGVAAARAELDRAGGVQLAFIDGDHSAEGVLRDFEAVEPSLNIGGHILLHDVMPGMCDWKGPRWLADNIHEVGRGRYQVCDIYTAPLNYGLTLLRRLA